MNGRVEVEVDADEDEDDCLSAAQDEFIANHPVLEGWDLEPRWSDEDDRSTVILSVPSWALDDERDVD